MSDVAIRVENLSKLYRIGGRQERYKTLRDTMMDVAASPVRRLRRLGQPTPPEETIWALKDVSLEVKHGEVLGIIGRNGAGKTTLLRILSRITEPTEGHAEIHGRVGSLLEVGTGFHPELTGRENIYLNGAILGMKRAEIDSKFDEIVAFAEIEKFLDTPVKRYSSGMYVRLAFAVAAHLEPEILLVDEVLAVGDAAFQKKCLGKMGDVAKEGRTVLFVSHNMAAVQSLCTRALLLDQGRSIADGKALPIIEQYSCQVQLENGIFDLTEHPRSGGNGKARIEWLRVVDANLTPTTSVPMGSKVGFVIAYHTSIPLDRADFVIGLYASLMQPVCQFSSARSGFCVSPNIGQGTVRCIVPAANFTTGRYYVNLAIIDSIRHEAYDHLTQAGAFDISEADVLRTGRLPDPLGGPCFFLAQWEYEQDLE